MSIDATSIIGKAQNRVLASKVLVQAVVETLEHLQQRAGIESTSASSGKKPNTNGDSNLTVDTSISRLQKKEATRQIKRVNEQDGDTTSSDEDEDEDSGSSDTASHISAEEDIPDDEFRGIGEGEDSKRGTIDSDEASDSEASTSSFPALTTISAKESNGQSKKRKARDMSPPTSSAFLPSLAAGYTLGDSDGSVYSDDDDVADTKPERKNRRGQRARRM